MSTTVETGHERIGRAFAQARGSAALMPYMMGGFPTPEQSLRIGEACIAAGADIIELGFPYSDPLADGPVIQAAGTRALEAGTNVAAVLEIAGRLSRSVPVVAMCYVNMVFAPGADAFVERLQRSGASGLIVPDLPHGGSPEVAAACERHGIALVPLAAPTTPPPRLREIASSARGFLYVVSVVGTTGERERLQDSAARLIGDAKEAASAPVAVGFGISTPEHAAAAAAAGADGVIVGTRLVRAAAEDPDPAGAVGGIVSELAAGLGRAR
ncbi:MAG TPA: tryptophan synthase subunit alpha [Solirubrobacteraceae bacterium]|nr:tryptophan synthase subunit alpha [Solirubrobacteraceae bacterium]